MSTQYVADRPVHKIYKENTSLGKCKNDSKMSDHSEISIANKCSRCSSGVSGSKGTASTVELDLVLPNKRSWADNGFPLVMVYMKYSNPVPNVLTDISQSYRSLANNLLRKWGWDHVREMNFPSFLSRVLIWKRIGYIPDIVWIQPYYKDLIVHKMSLLPGKKCYWAMIVFPMIFSMGLSL